MNGDGPAIGGADGADGIDAVDGGGERPDLEAELRQLEAASRDREAQLLDLADRVPAAVSRRATVRSMLSGVGGLFRRRRS